MTADGHGGPLTMFDRGAESAGTLGSDAGTVILDAASASRVTVPFDAMLLIAQYARDGDDLVLTGEGGADTFAYRLPSDGAAIAGNTTHGVAGADTLTDFLSGTDQIVLDLGGFGLSEGALIEGVNFEIIGAEYDGTNATNGAFADGNASIIRDNTGALIYDGNGAAEGYTVLIDSGVGTVQASDFHSQRTV